MLRVLNATEQSLSVEVGNDTVGVCCCIIRLYHTWHLVDEYHTEQHRYLCTRYSMPVRIYKGQQPAVAPVPGAAVSCNMADLSNDPRQTGDSTFTPSAVTDSNFALTWDDVPTTTFR